MLEINKKKFTITVAKIFVPFVTFSTNDNEKILQQLESGFKRTGIHIWNKYQSKVTIETQSQYLDS